MSNPEDFFRGLFEHLNQHKQTDDDFELLGPLSAQDAIEWKIINADDAKLKSEVNALKARVEMVAARRKLMWCKLEESTGIYDKNMRIIGNDLYIEKDKPEEPESPEVE